jgi:hypothetical protein
MGTGNNWDPTKRQNLLLIGNSIVIGGNPFGQKERLGTLVEKDLNGKYDVWPIAAGGWSNVNETVYLNRNPDVVSHANFFVWEYMNGGLSGMSQWASDYIFPRSHPVWTSWYAFRRYILPNFVSLNMNELPPTGSSTAQNQTEFETTIGRLSRVTGSDGTAGILFLYPTKNDYLTAKQGHEWLADRPELERIARLDNLMLVDITRSDNWNETMYRGDGVHPTVQGNVVLAHILTAAISKAQDHRPR